MVVFQEIYEQRASIQVGFGSSFLIEIGYAPPDTEFTFNFNGEELEGFPVPSHLPNLAFKEVVLRGDMHANYFGQMTAGEYRQLP